jgi:cell growth-regulating nucleolar protein
MSMVDHAPSVFETSRQLARITKEHDEESTYDLAFEENGFSYGAEPIRQQVFADTTNNHSQDFMTPGPKPKGEKDKPRSSGSLHVRNDSQNTTSSDKKRKRGGHVEDLNVSVANNARFEHEADTLMTDAPPSANATTGLTHSGLTGGLNRLMSKSEFPPSPDYSGGSDHHKDPASPLKRSRRDTHKPADDNGLGISIKGRAGRIMSTLGIAGGIAAATHTNGNTEKALVRTRRRSSSENDGSSQRQLVQQKRPRKHHKVHGRHTGTHSSQYVSSTQQPRHRSRRRSSNHEHHDSNSPDGRPARRLKAIEYKSHKANSTTPGSVSDSDAPAHTNGHRPQKSSGNPNQLVVYQSRSELFMSFVTKGPESERGCSINKVLKRYHRDLQLSGREDKAEEEKELWKGLRLRRNERGEVVVFCE